MKINEAMDRSDMKDLEESSIGIGRDLQNSNESYETLSQQVHTVGPRYPAAPPPPTQGHLYCLCGPIHQRCLPERYFISSVSSRVMFTKPTVYIHGVLVSESPH